MKHILLLLALCFSFSVQAQKIRFTDTSNKWSLLTTNPDGGSGRRNVSYSQEVTFYGKTYSLLLGHGFAVREDTSASKLYFLRVFWTTGNVMFPDTVEHIFFDYKLQQNDTFRMLARIWGDTATVTHVVQSVDSVQIGGLYHKVWHMKCATQVYLQGCGCIDYTFIEGIGTNNGPDFNVFPLVFEGCTQLRCFSTKGIYPPCIPSVQLPCSAMPGYFMPYDPASHFDNTTSCNFTPNSVTDASPTAAPILFPNPGNKNVVLRIPAQISKASLQVTDMSGRVVLQQQVEGGADFPFHTCLRESGVYLYTLQDARSGQRWTGKFVF